MVKCSFVDPSDNHVCEKSFQTEKLLFISPTEKIPYVFIACGNHSILRFNVLNLAEAEVQKQYERNEIKYQEKRDKMSAIWRSCRRCNESFSKDDIVWVLQYIRYSGDIQISLKKSFRIHKECALREMTLYGFGKEIIKDSKLDSFS